MSLQQIYTPPAGKKWRYSLDGATGLVTELIPNSSDRSANGPPNTLPNGTVFAIGQEAKVTQEGIRLSGADEAPSVASRWVHEDDPAHRPLESLPPHQKAIRGKADELRRELPAVATGHVRLWRGHKPQDELGADRPTRFTSSLEGIALPFHQGYGGHLSYVDVHEGDLPGYLSGGAKDAEFLLPGHVAKGAKLAVRGQEGGVPLPRVAEGPHGWESTELSLQFDLAAPPKKQTRESAFGYVECPPGAIKEVFAQCQGCAMMVDDNRCLIFRSADRVKPIGACNAFQHGTPVHAHEVTDDCFAGGKPKENGYVERPVRCENCSSFNPKPSRPHCELFERLNKDQPDYWGLDESVEPSSCCNSQSGTAEGRQLSLGVTRMAKGQAEEPDGEQALPGVYLVRHGKTKLNTDGESPDLIRGWLDVPLDDDGQKQAESLGPMGTAMNIQAVYSSDLQRARATADAVAEDAGVAVHPTKDLRPWNLGEFQGKSAADAAPKLVQYSTERPEEPVPGGESFEDWCNRYLPFLRRAMAEHEKTGENIALVTHYRNCKLAEAWVAGGCGEELDGDTFFSDDLKTGAVLRLYRKGGQWQVERVRVPGVRMSVRVRFAAEREQPPPWHEVREHEGKHGVFREGEEEPEGVFKDPKRAADLQFELNQGRKSKDEPWPPRLNQPAPKAAMRPTAAKKVATKAEAGKPATAGDPPAESLQKADNYTHLMKKAAENEEEILDGIKAVGEKHPDIKEVVEEAEENPNNPGQELRKKIEKIKPKLIGELTGHPQPVAVPTEGGAGAGEPPAKAPPVAQGEGGEGPKPPPTAEKVAAEHAGRREKILAPPEMPPERPAAAGQNQPQPETEKPPRPPSPVKGQVEPVKPKPVEAHEVGEVVTTDNPHNPGAPLTGRVAEKTDKYVRIDTDYGDSVTVPNGHMARGQDVEEHPSPLHTYAQGEDVEFEHPGRPGELVRGRIVGRNKAHKVGDKPAEERLVVETDNGQTLHVPAKTLGVYAKKAPKERPTSPDVAGRQLILPGMGPDETVGPPPEHRPNRQQELPGLETIPKATDDEEISKVKKALPGFDVEVPHPEVPGAYVVTDATRRPYIYYTEGGQAGQLHALPTKEGGQPERLTPGHFDEKGVRKGDAAGAAIHQDAEKNATQILKESEGKTDKKTKDEAAAARKKGEDWLTQKAGEKGWSHTLKILGLVLGGLYALHTLRRHPGGLGIMLALAGLYFWSQNKAKESGEAEGGKDAGSDEEAKKGAEELMGNMTPEGDPPIKPQWESPSEGKSEAKLPRGGETIKRESTYKHPEAKAPKESAPGAAVDKLEEAGPYEEYKRALEEKRRETDENLAKGPPPMAPGTPPPPNPPVRTGTPPPKPSGNAPEAPPRPPKAAGRPGAPMSPEEAQKALETESERLKVAGTPRPTNVGGKTAEPPPPTPRPETVREVGDLIAKVDAGGVPAMITNNLRRLFKETLGEEIPDDATPTEVVNVLRRYHDLMGKVDLNDMPDTAAKKATDKAIAGGANAADARAVGDMVRDYAEKHGTNRMMQWRRDNGGSRLSLAELVRLSWSGFLEAGGTDSEQNFRRLSGDATRLSLAHDPHVAAELLRQHVHALASP